MAARSRLSNRPLAALVAFAAFGAGGADAAPAATSQAASSTPPVLAKTPWAPAAEPAAARQQGKAPVYVTPGYKKKTKPLATTPVFPPTRPLIKLSDLAREPRVLLDAAGTAHITWIERGTTERPGDVEVYCRLPRAAQGCDVSHRWPEAYLPEIGVSNTGGVIPLQLGDDLGLLTARYPYSGVPIPGRPAENTPDYQNGTATFLDLSVNGGDTFTPRTYVGDGPVANATVFGPAATPSIAAITDTVTGGTSVQSYTGGQTTLASALVGPGDQAYGGAITTDGDRPVAAFTDASGNGYVSRWTGNGSPNDAGTWETGSIGVASDPVLSGGPAGTFLLAKPGLVGPELQVRRITGVAAGAPVNVEPGGFGTITQDGAGQVYTGRVQQDRSTRYLMQRGDGTTFGSAVPIAELPEGGGQGFTESRLAVRPDGGGVVVASGSGGIFNQLWVTSFGTQAPTGLPGIGRKPGGGIVGPPAVVECGRITFGAIEMRTLDGCFFTAASAAGARAATPGAATRSQAAGVRVAVGPIDLNGVKLRPDPGVQIQIDPNKKTIDTTGTVSVQFDAPGGAITLFRGELHLQLPRPNERTLLASFDASKFAAIVKGFPISGKIDLELTDKGLRVPINLELPPIFGGIRGQAVLVSQIGSGLKLDSLRIEIDEAFVGGPTIRNALLTYSAGDDAKGIPSEWFGKAELVLPPGRGSLSFYAEVRFVGGKFKEGFLEVRLPYPGLPLYAGVYLSKVRGGFGLDPTKIRIGASVGVFPIGTEYLVNVNADLAMTFGTPWRVEVTGSADILGTIPVAQLKFIITGDGYALFDGRVNFTLGSDDAGVSIESRNTLAFDFDRGLFSGRFQGAKVTIRFPAPFPDLAVPSVDIAVSNRGFGVCVANGGATWTEQDGLTVYPPLVGSCDVGPIEIVITPKAARAIRARAARVQGAPAAVRTQAAAMPIRLSGGKGAYLHLRGQGGAPQVALVDPSGRRIELARPASVAELQGARASLLASGDTSIVTVRSPRKGRWQVVPLPGSPPIASIRRTELQDAPRLKTRVTRSGSRFTLHYELRGGTKLGATITEDVKDGQHVIGTIKQGKGTLRFTPAGGAGGRRKLTAQFTRDGIPVSAGAAGSYTAPPPTKPTAPRKVTIKRTKGGVTVRWTPGKGADAQVVSVKTGDGLSRRFTVSRKARSVKVPEVDADDKASANVSGVTGAGRTGPKASATLKAPKPRR